MRNLLPKTWRLHSRHKQVIVVVIATFAFALFLTSWRILLGNGATVDIIPEEEYAFVIVDGDIKGISNNANEPITTTLSEGKHQILVSKENHWPWSKDLIVGDDESNITLLPFFIPQEPQIENVSPDNAQYQNILSFFDKDIPTKENRYVSQDLKVHVWIENETDIVVQWIGNENPKRSFCQETSCREAYTIFSGKEKITSVDFYKNRNDVLIASTNDIIFVIEVSKDTPQNFQPIYEGRGLRFARPENATDPDLLFIRENQTVFATWI